MVILLRLRHQPTSSLAQTRSNPEGGDAPTVFGFLAPRCIEQVTEMLKVGVQNAIIGGEAVILVDGKRTITRSVERPSRPTGLP